ncbi:MAG TPA: tripartite tricarboxylate transporter substrate binding protein [Burkholderiales bacterium]|nr:tripartite tricarboxylate transporter substrate binding protein [Burkholderiales bacterium]
MKLTIRCVIGCTLALVGHTAAVAQTYPQKPVRFVVPYSAGGAGDIFARTIGQKLTEALGQTFTIDNRPGANAIIGMEIVAKAPPDGYTIVMGNSAPMVLNPSLYAKLPYDPVKDFAPVTQGTLYPYTLIVHPSVPVHSVAELVKFAKAHPGKLQYGSSGNGAANHLAGEMFKHMAGINIIHVPFKGSAPALADVLGGQISMMFDTLVTTVPQLKSHKVRSLAVTGAKRAPQVPDIPTMSEAGFKGYEVTSWQSILAPAGTPRPIIQKLYEETIKALRQPDVIDRLATQGGNELVGNTPEEFARIIRNEIAMYSRVIKEANVRLE